MKTTVKIDDDLLARAKKFSGVTDNPKLIQRSIEYIIAYQKALIRGEEMNDYDEVRKTVRRLYDKIDDE